MIPGLKLATSAASDLHHIAANTAHSDKGFISVLRSSVQKAADTSDDCNPHASVAANSASRAGKSKNSSVHEEQPASNKTSDQQNDKEIAGQDPAEILRQIVMQMTVAAQQAIQLPQGSTEPAFGATQELKAAIQLISGNHPEQQMLQSQTALQGGQSGLAAGFTPDATAANKGEVSETTSGKNPVDLKNGAANPLKIISGEEPAAAISGFEDASKIKVDPGAESFNLPKGMNSAADTSESADDGLYQWKIESGQAKAGSDNGTVKDASGLYAQTLQPQPSSGHGGQAVQETVPVSKLSSVDEVISKAMDTGQKNLVIKVDPPDLGSIRIRLSFDNGVLKADVRVDSGSVRDSFNLALPQIRNSLENSGIKISEFHVDVREDQYGNGQQRNNQERQQQRQSRESGSSFSDFFA